MFFDHAKIHVAAGKGGNGCVSFRREMHVPRGGPDGGDGGRGGDVILVGDPQVRDLQAFTYRIHFKAEAGGAGQGARKHGANGETVVISVPLGTQVWTIPALDDLPVDPGQSANAADAPEAAEGDGALVADLVVPGREVMIARGGSGGHGNARFVNSVRQAPKFAELGEQGESRWLRLSLKLIADAGLAGLPNAGKSSLLRRLSNAKPKVADYPFTTVEPMLGVVDWSGEGDVFTLADVPGLLEGASDGVGLGHEFLAHLERCRLLLHVVDATGYYGVDPLEGFQTILLELDAHASTLAGKPQVVVLNKIDAMDATAVEELRDVFAGEVERLRAGNHPAFAYVVGEDTPLARQLVWPVSAATGAGLSALLHWIGPLLHELRTLEDDRASLQEGVRVPAMSVASASLATVTEEGHTLYRPATIADSSFSIFREKDGFMVRGTAVRRLVSRFDLTDEEAIRYVGERLDRLGVYAALRAKGAQPGDDVDIEGYAFEFQ